MTVHAIVAQQVCINPFVQSDLCLHFSVPVCNLLPYLGSRPAGGEKKSKQLQLIMQFQLILEKRSFPYDVGPTDLTFSFQPTSTVIVCKVNKMFHVQ